MAAGRGSRLENLTDDIPKAFLEIKGIKLIEYNLAVLHHFGIKDIYIITGYKNEYFEELTKNTEGIKCIYNPFYESMNVLGSFFMGQEHLKDIDTVYMHADTLCAPEIIKKMINTDGDMVLPVEFKTCDEEAMKISTNEDKVVKISKEIPLSEAEGEFIGICKISGYCIPLVKKSAKKLMKEKAFKSYFEGAIQDIIDNENVNITTIPVNGYFWGEVDFKEDYEYVINNLPDNLYEIAAKSK